MFERKLTDFTTYGNNRRFAQLVEEGITAPIRAHIEYKEGRERRGLDVRIVGVMDGALIIHASRSDKDLGSIVERRGKFYGAFNDRR
jgi:hypothetical protein